MDKFKRKEDVIKYSIYFDFGVAIVTALIGIICFFLKTSELALKLTSFAVYILSAFAGFIGYMVYKNQKFDVYKGGAIYTGICVLNALHLLINPFKMDKIIVFSCGIWMLATALVVLDYFFYYKHKKEKFANIIGIITAIMVVFSLVVLYNVFFDIQFGKTVLVITFKDTVCVAFLMFGGLKAVVNNLIMKENK